MKWLIPAVLVAMLSSVSAQEVIPHTAPSGAAKSSSVEKLDGPQKTGNAQKQDAASSPVASCVQCPDRCPIEQPHTQTEKEKADAASLDRLYRRYMQATIVGVAGAWIGIIILIWQTISAKHTAQRQLRAYVLPELGNIVNVAVPMRTSGAYTPTEARITHPDWGPVVGMQIKNTGQTPAFKVEHWGNILFREYPLKSDLPGPAEGLIKSASTIGPGIINTKRSVLAKPLTEKEIAQLRDNTGAIYVYGFIFYEDAFGRKHTTHYRMFHNQNSGAVGVSTDLTFAEGGNEAD